MPSGEPSCTVCSRLILESGIENVVLLEEVNGKEVYIKYNAREFNELSFDYFTKISYSAKDLIEDFKEIKDHKNNTLAIPLLEGIFCKWINSIENNNIVSEVRKPRKMNECYTCVFLGRIIEICGSYDDMSNDEDESWYILKEFSIHGDGARKLMNNFKNFLKDQDFKDVVRAGAERLSNEDKIDHLPFGYDLLKLLDEYKIDYAHRDRKIILNK